MSSPVVTNPLNINPKVLQKPAKSSKINHLKYTPRSNLNKLFSSHFNTNSVRNKLESAVKDISSNVDLLYVIGNKN